jgi:hypothetical protein
VPAQRVRAACAEIRRGRQAIALAELAQQRGRADPRLARELGQARRGLLALEPAAELFQGILLHDLLQSDIDELHGGPARG